MDKEKLLKQAEKDFEKIETAYDFLEFATEYKVRANILGFQHVDDKPRKTVDSDIDCSGDKWTCSSIDGKYSNFVRSDADEEDIEKAIKYAWVDEWGNCGTVVRAFSTTTDTSFVKELGEV